MHKEVHTFTKVFANGEEVTFKRARWVADQEQYVFDDRSISDHDMKQIMAAYRDFKDSCAFN